jgi:hypothetical protein
MRHTACVIGLAFAMIGFALGQQPLTPGVGQYCSNYAKGFTSDLGGRLIVYEMVNWEWMTDCVRYSCTNALACECLPGACANQADPACPWALGPSCGVTYPCVGCYDNCGFCGDSSTTLFCNPGCVTVSPCTPIPNAYFTAPANPSTSSNACPWACNAGYTKSGSVCIQTAVSTTCPPGSYLQSIGSTVCIKCTPGSYSTASGGNASSTCIKCSPGSYSTASGGNASSTCIKCTPGSYSTASGGNASSTCIKCSPGSYSTASGGNASSTCIKCTPGSYSTASGANTSNTCAQCPPGKYSTALGATSNTACVACKSCGLQLEVNPCAAGSANDTVQCVCRPGTYGPLCAKCGKGGVSGVYILRQLPDSGNHLPRGKLF